ncbi:UNVERIFIED_CONTAM: hypothetical protein K2H54_033243 [Gekko kuhli]
MSELGTFRGTAYIKLTSVAPATVNSAQAQSTLATVSVPRKVAGTASNIIGLAVTTECDPLQRSSRNCRCLPGYWWNNNFCATLQACEVGGFFQPLISFFLPPPCQCLRWTSSDTGYCQSLLSAWKVSQSSTLPPKQASVGAEDDLTLSFSLAEGATGVKWYLLRPPAWSEAKEIRTGTEVMLLQKGSEAVLRVSSPSPDWADGDLFCPGENLQGRWNVTKSGRVAEIRCPKGREGTMLRSCFSDGTWGAIQNNCTDKELLSKLHEAQLLQAGLGSPQSEIPWIIEWLKMEMKPSQNQSIYPLDLLTLVFTMDIISQVALDSNMRLESSSVTDLLYTVNWMLDLDTETKWSEVQARRQSAGSMFLKAIEDLTSLLEPPTTEFNLTLPNLELQSSMFNLTWIDDFTKIFNTDPPLRSHISREELVEVVQREHSITVISLVLKNMDQILPGHYGVDASHVLGSLVMSSAIVAHNGSVRQVDIEMMFGLWNTTRNLEEKQTAQCVSWNHGLLEGTGGWSSQDCQSSSTEMVANCSCHRLTSFSVLMSAYPVPVSFALTFLSKFGVCATILALVVCLFIYGLVWTSVVKNKVSYFCYTTLVNISFSLLMGSLWFLGVSQLKASHVSRLCVAVAFFTHFFYLAKFFWMLVQALLLCHQLIFVFHHLSIWSVMPAMVAVGYVCPLVIAVATVAAFFPRQTYLNKAVCWLSFRSKAIYAFFVPILVIVIVNILVLFMVLLKLMRPSVSEGPQGEEKKALLGIFKALLILTPIFGLTWVLGVITMTSDASQLTHYAFTILNSFQALILTLTTWDPHI